MITRTRGELPTRVWVVLGHSVQFFTNVQWFRGDGDEGEYFYCEAGPIYRENCHTSEQEARLELRSCLERAIGNVGARANDEPNHTRRVKKTFQESYLTGLTGSRQVASDVQDPEGPF